jgi:hypothetical protein
MAKMILDPSIEMDFVRQFSGGDDLLRDLSAENRRERIRLAIYTHKLVNLPFRDSGMDYKGAYEKCYGRPLEMRRHLRLVPQSDESDPS